MTNCTLGDTGTDTTYLVQLNTYQQSNGHKRKSDNSVYYPKLDPRSSGFCYDGKLLIIGYSLQANAPDPDGDMNNSASWTDWNAQRGTLLVDFTDAENPAFEQWDYRVDTTTFEAFVFERVPNLSLTFL